MTRAEARAEAQRLVVGEGYTYAQAAEATGIPLGTIERWGGAEEWVAQRSTASSYDARMRRIKHLTLERYETALSGGAPAGPLTALLNSVTALEKAYPEHRYTPRAEKGARLAVGAEVVAALVDHLAATDRAALTILAPHLEAFAAHWEKACAA